MGRGRAGSASRIAIGTDAWSSESRRPSRERLRRREGGLLPEPTLGSLSSSISRVPVSVEISLYVRNRTSVLGGQKWVVSPGPDAKMARDVSAVRSHLRGRRNQDEAVPPTYMWFRLKEMAGERSHSEDARPSRRSQRRAGEIRKERCKLTPCL